MKKFQFSVWYCTNTSLSLEKASIICPDWLILPAWNHIRMKRNWKRARAREKVLAPRLQHRRLLQQLISPQTIANIKDLRCSNGKSIHLNPVRCKGGERRKKKGKEAVSENTDGRSWEGMNGEINGKEMTRWASQGSRNTNLLAIGTDVEGKLPPATRCQLHTHSPGRDHRLQQNSHLSAEVKLSDAPTSVTWPRWYKHMLALYTEQSNSTWDFIRTFTGERRGEVKYGRIIRTVAIP